MGPKNHASGRATTSATMPAPIRRSRPPRAPEREQHVRREQERHEDRELQVGEQHAPQRDSLHDRPRERAPHLPRVDRAHDLLPEQKLDRQPEPVHQVEMRVVVEVAQDRRDLQRSPADQRQAGSDLLSAQQHEEQPAVEHANRENDDVDDRERAQQRFQQRPQRKPDGGQGVIAVVGRVREHDEVVLVHVQARRGQRVANPPEIPVVVEEIVPGDFHAVGEDQRIQRDERQADEEAQRSGGQAQLG